MGYPGLTEAFHLCRLSARWVLTPCWFLYVTQVPPLCPALLRVFVPPLAAEESAILKEPDTPDTTGKSCLTLPELLNGVTGVTGSQQVSLS